MDEVEQLRRDMQELARKRDKAQEPVSTGAVAKAAKAKPGSGHSKACTESSTLNKKLGQVIEVPFLECTK